MKIFITGASGFVGSAVAKHFATQHTVLAMARSVKSAKKIKALGAEAVSCDLQSVSGVHLAGCDVVIHCAAFAEEWGTEEDFFIANVEGTKKMLEAAQAAKVKRFIFIGTEAALFQGQDLIDVDEETPYATGSPYPYSRTKAEAEKLVLAANSPDFVTISLRPRMIWGPGDQSILPAILEMIERRQFMWIGNGAFKTSTTHIENVTHAIELTIARGNGGQAYFITDDEVVVMKEFLSRYIATQGIRVPRKSVPRWIARMTAKGSEWIWSHFRIRGKPPLVRFTIDIMSAHCTLNIEKAKRDLGYSPIIGVERGLATMPRLPAT